MFRRLLLGASALVLPATAHADWYKAESQHFVVYADDKPENVKAYTTKLERYDKAMKVMRGLPDDRRGPASRVVVFQLDDMAAIRKLYGKGGESVGGFYQPASLSAFVPRTSGGTGGVFDTSADRILLHEYAHHFMFSDWPSAIIPRWYAEGFAEYNSTAIFKPNGDVIFGAPPTDRLYGVADQNGMPLSTMLDPGLGRLDGRQTYALYSRGWALAHYLQQDPQRRKMLADYIGALNEGKPLSVAATALGSTKALDDKLVSYVKRPAFNSQLVPGDKIKIGEVTVRLLTPGEAAIMPALIASRRMVDKDTAPKVAAVARSLAAPFPNDAAVQNELAEAEYDACSVDETSDVACFSRAETAADRALSADPKSVHAMLYKGMVKQAVAEKTKGADAKQWGEVRRWYIAANRADTENPEPLILFYRSFHAAGQQPTASAQTGMLYANALAPYDTSLRLDAGLILLGQGKASEARQQLAQLAYAPHGGKMSEKMRSGLATLDKSGPEAARKELVGYLNQQEAEAKANPGKKKDNGDD